MNARLKTAAASLVLAITGIACTQTAPQDPALVAKWKDMNLYSMKTKTLEGKDIDLGEYKGKVALVVNVASRCGMTPQYNGLEKLYGELKGQGFVILGMPCNDFGGQEPGTAEEIRSFCSTKYNVTFPMFTKVQTKPGAGQSDLRVSRDPHRQAAGLELREVPDRSRRPADRLLRLADRAGRQGAARGDREGAGHEALSSPVGVTRR